MEETGRAGRGRCGRGGRRPGIATVLLLW